MKKNTGLLEILVGIGLISMGVALGQALQYYDNHYKNQCPSYIKYETGAGKIGTC
jgi:hypothetical protein